MKLKCGVFEGTIIYEDGLYHGRVLDVYKVLSYKGETLEELYNEFKKKVDEYAQDYNGLKTKAR